MRNLILLLLCVSFISSSCTIAHVSSEDTSVNYYPSKTSIDDIAYIENVTKPHEMIGVVTISAERNRPMAEILEKIKREAAVLGGDAVTDIQTDATGTWKRLPAQKIIGNAYVRANFSAAVVVFK